jgi:hypothetical protein
MGMYIPALLDFRVANLTLENKIDNRWPAAK